MSMVHKRLMAEKSDQSDETGMIVKLLTNTRPLSADSAGT